MIYQPIPDKRCTKCGNWYSRDGFNLRRASRDSLAPICRSCDNMRSRKYLADHRDDLNLKSRLRRLDHLEERRKYNRLYEASHRQEANERNRRYRANHPDKIRETTRRVRAKNPELHRNLTRRRRAKRRGLPDAFTDQDWQRCLDYWHGCCAYCGNPPGLLPSMKLCADHFIPLGSPDCPGTVPANILPACKSCNSRKHDFDAREWLIRKLGKRKAAAKLREIEAYFESLINDKS